jgi:hypothetical protein
MADPAGSEPDYYRALGRFIEEYAEAELAMSSLLWSMARVRPEIARAIFSGTRSDAASKYINRLFDVREDSFRDLRPEFEMVSTQLGHIRDARNLIIHNETVRGSDGEPFLITNRHVALDKKRLIERPISAAILHQMTCDVKKIVAHLLMLLFTSEKTATVLLLIAKTYAEELRASFQYKPPPVRSPKEKLQAPRDRPKGKAPSGQC